MSWWMICGGGWALFMLFFLFVWWPRAVGKSSDKDE